MINFCHKFHDFHQMYIVYTTDSVAYKGEKVKKSLVESIFHIKK